MTRALAALGLLLLVACGKYGPPLRASEVAAKKPATKLEIPLPQPPGSVPAAEPEPTPAPETAPAPEEEPPPEGEP